MLLNLAELQWDSKLLELFKIPAHLMPSIQPSLGLFGYTQPELLGESVPITAILGDQQASLFAHGCDRPGLLKCTYGTGCFLIAHTGEQLQRSQNQLLSTVAWTQSGGVGEWGRGREGENLSPSPSHKVGYALEGSMFTAGACIQSPLPIF